MKSFQPFACVPTQTHRVFWQNSPSLAQNSPSRCSRNSIPPVSHKFPQHFSAANCFVQAMHGASTQPTSPLYTPWKTAPRTSFRCRLTSVKPSMQSLLPTWSTIAPEIGPETATAEKKCKMEPMLGPISGASFSYFGLPETHLYHVGRFLTPCKSSLLRMPSPVSKPHVSKSAFQGGAPKGDGGKGTPKKMSRHLNV